MYPTPGCITKLGKKYLKHSSPLNLSLFHFLDESSNVIKAIEFSRKEYGKFKRLFVEVATNLGYEGDIKIHFDKIIKKTQRQIYNDNNMIPPFAPSFLLSNLNSLPISKIFCC